MEIKHATELEFDKVCEILATEFYNDPVLNHAFDDTDRKRRMAALQSFFEIYVDLAKKYGGILLAENNIGALVYFRPEMIGAMEKNKIDEQLRQKCERNYKSVALLMNGLDNYHPQNIPHYYIFVIAVKSLHRRKGVAMALLTEFNSILDKNKYPCYSECTTSGTQALFIKAGYVGSSQSILIDAFPLLLPVWRDPQ
jgi:predicted acetyltransferase